MIDRAYLQVLADEVRPGWRISGPFGVATVSAVHHNLDGIDLAYRPHPRTTGNSQHFQAKAGDSFVRLADDEILERIEAVIVHAVTADGVVPFSGDGSALIVDVDGVSWTLPLRAGEIRHAEPVDENLLS